VSEEMLKAGEKLLRLLGKRSFPFRAALWIYLSDAEEWRLFLAVPKAREEGKRKFYKRLQNLVEKESDLPLFSALTIVDAKDPLIYSIGVAVKVGDVAGRKLSRGRINGRYFEDAYVYPLTT